MRKLAAAAAATVLCLAVLVARAQPQTVCPGIPSGPTNSIWNGCQNTPVNKNCSGTCRFGEPISSSNSSTAAYRQESSVVWHGLAYMHVLPKVSVQLLCHLQLPCRAPLAPAHTTPECSMTADYYVSSPITALCQSNGLWAAPTGACRKGTL